MSPRLARVWASLWLVSAASPVLGQPPPIWHELSWPETEVDVVGDPDGRESRAQKALQDTIWIADWTFDFGAPCQTSGWTMVDNRILNDGVVHWQISAAHGGVGGIDGTAAVLAETATPCCLEEGYANDWHQAIRLTYAGPAALSFDYLLDSESGRDFLRVETDSACGSFARVDYVLAPQWNAASYRTIVFEDSGLDLAGSVQNLSLTDFGAGTHCVYISFFSNWQVSPCDGLRPSTLGAAAVIDDLQIVDASGVRSEDFGDGTLDIGTFANIQDSEPFGSWARIFPHVTDNDFCTENMTCAWLWTDDTTPTVANDPGMAFGPGGYVIRNWLDNSIVSPWVSLAGTPNAPATVLQYRRFPGNFFSQSRIVQNWSVRGRKVTGTDTCISSWGHASSWNSLDDFRWLTPFIGQMWAYFDATSSDIQVRHRTSDWQWLMGAPPPTPFVPGPGPYIDRTRIGRWLPSGPLISESVDARTQAQDCFPTELAPGFPPVTGEHYRPTHERFGTCAFSMAQSISHTFNLIIGDSIAVYVTDARVAGGVTSIDWYGTIASGPHAGKAPAPWNVGANGFFVVPVDSSRFQNGVSNPNFYFVDLDDTYFRGGDILHYFWLASDVQGGMASDPIGLTAVPASIEQAEQATGGLLEVSFLPAIDWSPDYLARIAADAHGDLEPTAEEIAASRQRNCILYVQFVNARRRSGDANRTSFMYTLDQLGYRGHYDVYDHTGLGNVNNQLGGRATVEQAEGYNLIVYDAAHYSDVILPDGSDWDLEKIDQVTWFRNWLARASVSEAGFATLWMLGTNVVQGNGNTALLATDMGVVLNQADQGLRLNPEVAGVTSFTFDRGGVALTTDFGADSWGLSGKCPPIRTYDGLGSSGTAVVTHRYRDPATLAIGDGALVMNRSASENWNTIMQSHPWFDIVDAHGTSPGAARSTLLHVILGSTLPAACQQGPNPTDLGSPESQSASSLQTVLHQNIPNPFNPMTTIRFDLAKPGRVAVLLHDVAGHLVRRLLDAELAAGRDHAVVWDGLDGAGRRVPSGVYLYRLETTDGTRTRKLLLLR